MEKLSLYEDFSKMKLAGGGTDLRHVRETYRALLHWAPPAPMEGIMLAAPHGPVAEVGTEQSLHWAYPPVDEELRLTPRGYPAVIDTYLEFDHIDDPEYTEYSDPNSGRSVCGCGVVEGKVGGYPVPIDKDTRALRITLLTSEVSPGTYGTSLKVSLWDKNSARKNFNFPDAEQVPEPEFAFVPLWDIDNPAPAGRYYMKGLPNVLKKFAVAFGTDHKHTVNLPRVQRVDVPLTLVSNENWTLTGGATDEVDAVSKPDNAEAPGLATDQIASSVTYSRTPSEGLPRVYFRAPGLGTNLYTDLQVGDVKRTTRHLISVNSRPYGMSRDFVQDGNITVSTRKPDLFLASMFRGSLKTLGPIFSLAYLRDDIVNNQWEVGEIGRLVTLEVDTTGNGPYGQDYEYGVPVVEQGKQMTSNLRLHLPSLLSTQYGYNGKFAIEFWFKHEGPLTAEFSPILSLGAFGYSRADGMAFEFGLLSDGIYGMRENYDEITGAINMEAQDGVWTFCRLSVADGSGQVRVGPAVMGKSVGIDPNRPFANTVAYGGNAISHIEDTDGSLRVYLGPMRVVYGDNMVTSPIPSAPWPAP